MRSFETVDFGGKKQRKKVALRKDGGIYMERNVQGGCIRGLHIYPEVFGGTVLNVDNLDNLVALPVADISVCTKVLAMNVGLHADLHDRIQCE
jgi:hypothetical protein